MIYSFISYSSKDVKFAEKLDDDLSATNVKTWRDRKRLLGDQFWDQEIEKALSDRNLTHVLVLLSQNSVNSEMVLNEVDYAKGEGKTLIPLMIEDCKIPLLLRRRNYVDFRNDYQSGFEFLQKTLQASQSSIIIPTQVSIPSTPSLKLTPQQIIAAHDPHRLVRLIAGPGTGKSLVIEEKVNWLLSKGIDPESISVVSFTRAASRDLKNRIVAYCSKNQKQVYEIRVTTLHSLALTVLRKAKLLNYPSYPQVLDEWELEHIFDTEFSETMRNTSPSLAGLTPSRATVIRDAWDAFWNTGKWDPPNYIQPDKPVTEAEKTAFKAFHGPTTHVYSCVLPGEIIKICVDHINAGVLNPSSILGTQHLIVDEFQDLNFTDLQFVDAFIISGVNTFIAGDDDQSIYSFRYAYPRGIQEFSTNYAQVSSHQLEECFRCSPAILRSSQNLVENYQTPGRIIKTAHSFCEDFTPRLDGIMHRWIFKSENAEYEAIAHSCKSMIDRGIKPRNILILISNKRALLSGTPSLIQKKFESIGIPIEMPNGERYIDTESGRLTYALLRIACDLNLQDYIAHRTVLGSLKGVGPKAYNGIREKVIKNNLNYLEVFYGTFPSGLFDTIELKAIEKVKVICENIKDWRAEDSIVIRSSIIESLIRDTFGDEAAQEWINEINYLPNDMSIKEVRDYLATDNSEQQEIILESVYKRLDLAIPTNGILPQQVRIMTMHGAKGLNADVVFIPGLEEDILPGDKRKRSTGLVQEAARQLYVSITRTRLACFASYSSSRRKHGKVEFGRAPSQYCVHLNGKFQQRGNGLTDAEAEEIIQADDLYRAHLDTRLAQL